MNPDTLVPMSPGFYWAKWRIASDTTPDRDDLTPSDRWEPVEVFETSASHDIASHVDALKALANASTDDELAAAIGCKRSEVAAWRKRGRIPAADDLRIMKRLGREAGFAIRAPALGGAQRPVKRGSNIVFMAFVSGVSAPQPLDSFVWGARLSAPIPPRDR